MNQNTTGERSFKKLLNYKNLFWLFIMGSLMGFVLEGLWSIIRRGGWENHSATLWGPFCIIYGIAAMLFYTASFWLVKRNIFVQFLLCALGGSALEYAASYIQEICFHSTSWNYSKQFLNIGGRISLRMTFLWGILGVLFVRYIFPFLSKLFLKMDGKAFSVLCVALSGFMSANLVVTSLAVLRWGERVAEEPPSNAIEELLDEVYGDEKMKDVFSNMVHKTAT